MFACVIVNRDNPFFYDYNLFYIDDICVLEKHRRKGIGRSLLDACKAAAKEHVLYLFLDRKSNNSDFRLLNPKLTDWYYRGIVTVASTASVATLAIICILGYPRPL